MRLYLAILIGTAALAALPIALRRRMCGGAWLAAAGMAAAGLACALCVFALRQGALYAAPMPDPGETAAVFFDGVCSGDYAGAYAVLGNYASLGLEEQPGEENAARVYAAVAESRAWQALGAAEVSGLSARQTVRLTCLDAAALTRALPEVVSALLAEAQETLDPAQMVDEANAYLPEFTETLYSQALDTLLSERGRFLRETEVACTLEYDGSAWHLMADAALVSALCGGIGEVG